MHRKPLPTLFFVIAVLVLLPLLYVGSYVALLRPKVAFESVPVKEPTAFALEPNEQSSGYQLHYSEMPPIPTSRRAIIRPAYRVEGSLIEAIFWPAFLVDRALRPTRWEKDS
jgi:hypothetical protein